MEQLNGIEPSTSGLMSGALPLSYNRNPTSVVAPYAGLASPPARAEHETPTVVLTPVFDRERAYSRER